MSCGDPHETDCSDVLERIDAYLDHELDEHTVDKIRAHLEECAPCLREHDVEHAVKALVARAGRAPAPDHLRARIAEAVHRLRQGADRPVG
ncbi:MAG: mycothiol system anti-sigma-R factor [Kineosporiaceae bacterium]